MPLDVCSDLSPADWIVASHIPWKRLVTIGPGGFSAYVRVRFIPDPTHVGQRENEADLDGSPDEIEQWRAMLQLLSEETADPDDCYFGLWDGWGFPTVANLRRHGQRRIRGSRLLPVSRVAVGCRDPRNAGPCWDLEPARVRVRRDARVRLARRSHVVHHSRC